MAAPEGLRRAARCGTRGSLVCRAQNPLCPKKHRVRLKRPTGCRSEQPTETSAALDGVGGRVIVAWLRLWVNELSSAWGRGDCSLSFGDVVSWVRVLSARWPALWFLFLSVGLRQRARIAVSDVAEVTIGGWDKAGEGELLAVVQGAANVRLAFRTPANVRPDAHRDFRRVANAPLLKSRR